MSAVDCDTSCNFLNFGGAERAQRGEFSGFSTTLDDGILDGEEDAVEVVGVICVTINTLPPYRPSQPC